MNKLALLLISAACMAQDFNGPTTQFLGPLRLTQGSSAPASGDCDASTETGRVYLQTGNPASVATRALRCAQTGASSYAWMPIGYVIGTTAPATCTVGDTFFDTDATAGSNLFGCTAANTWTLLGGSGSASNVILSKELGSYGNIPGVGGNQCQAGLTVNNTGTGCIFLPVGGTLPEGVVGLSMPESGATSFTVSEIINTGYTAAANVTVTLYGTTETPASGDMRVSVKTSCIRPGTTSMNTGLTWNTASAANFTVSTTLMAMEFTGVSATGCAVGDIFLLNVERLPANAGDTSIRILYAPRVKVTY